MKWGSRLFEAVLLLALSAAAASVAGAAGRGTGTVVVRLVTDPSPPGVSWSYSGLGAPFRLGVAGSQRVVSMPVGSYHLLESAVGVGQSRTLTAIVGSDLSGDTTVDLGGSAAMIALGAGGTVTCIHAPRARVTPCCGRRSARTTLTPPLLRFATSEAYRPLGSRELPRAQRAAGRRAATGNDQPVPADALLASHLICCELSRRAGRAAECEPGAISGHRAGSPETTNLRPTIYWHSARARPHTGRDGQIENGSSTSTTISRTNTKPIGRAPPSFSTTVRRSASATRSTKAGKWVVWSSTSTSAGSPVVYVARGSHGTIPVAGRYAVRVCWILGGLALHADQDARRRDGHRNETCAVCVRLTGRSAVPAIRAAGDRATTSSGSA